MRISSHFFNFGSRIAFAASMGSIHVAMWFARRPWRRAHQKDGPLYPWGQRSRFLIKPSVRSLVRSRLASMFRRKVTARGRLSMIRRRR